MRSTAVRLGLLVAGLAVGFVFSATTCTRAIGASCDYAAKPPTAITNALEHGGFTYAFLHCTRYGIAYYAFTDNTTDAKHPTLTERVFLVTPSVRVANIAFAHLDSHRGRVVFLTSFREFVTRVQDGYRRTVRPLSVTRSGAIVRLEAIARASPR